MKVSGFFVAYELANSGVMDLQVEVFELAKRTTDDRARHELYRIRQKIEALGRKLLQEQQHIVNGHSLLRKDFMDDEPHPQSQETSRT